MLHSVTTVICLSPVLNIACSDSSDIVTKSNFDKPQYTETVELFVEDFQKIIDFRQSQKTITS